MSITDVLLGLPSETQLGASDPEHRVGATVARLSLVVASGSIVGALTEWSVLHVPFALKPLSNSAAPWVIVAFVAALTARSVRESLGLAVVSLVALIVGFYVAQSTRGWSVSGHQIVFWSATAMVAGPVIGLAAGWLRHARGSLGAIGAGVLGGLLVGEAVHGLTQPTFLSPHVYWHVQFGLGVALAIALVVWCSRGRRLRGAPLLAASLGACATVALATAAVYQMS